MTTENLRLLELARLAARPEGVRSTECSDPHWAGGKLLKWYAAGKIAKITLAWRNVRYFSNKKHAEAYSTGNAPMVTIKHAPAKAWWPKDAEPYYPLGLKITQCPGPALSSTRNGWGPAQFGEFKGKI